MELFCHEHVYLINIDLELVDYEKCKNVVTNKSEQIKIH